MIFFSNPTFVPILSALLGAVAAVLARTLLRDTSAKRMLSTNFFTMAAVLLVLSPLFYSFNFTSLTFGLVLLIAGIDTLANYFYFKTFEQTEASTAIPILSLAPVVTFLASGLFLQEHPSVITVILSLVILCLVILVSTDWKSLPKFSANTLYPALIASLLLGLSAIPCKYLLTTLHATNAPTLYMIRAALISIFAALLFRQPVGGLDTKTYRIIFVRGLFVIGQWILLYYALTLGSAGVAVTLGNITPIFVLILGFAFLREKLDWKKGLAALAILVLSLMLK